MKSKSYAMWMCDSCENGIEHGKRTKHLDKNKKYPCIFCKKGKMAFEPDVTFEITE